MVAIAQPILLKMNKFLAVNVVVLVITTVKYVRNVPASDIIITEIKVETLPLLRVTEIDVGQKNVNALFQGMN